MVDWDAGTASADPTFDQSSCGTAVSNFTSADVLAGLQTNAGAGVEWVAGIGHPTFVWDDNNIPADYTAVDAAIAKANALNKDNYKDFSAVETAVNAVVRDKNITEQSEVDAMAKAIEDAIAALEKKPASTKPGTSDKSPQTGDISNLALWIALLFVSGGAAIGTTVVSRKKKYNR